jgi:hypothetical protein
MFADELGVSRATVYSYLKQARSEPTAGSAAEAPPLALVLASGSDWAPN